MSPNSVCSPRHIEVFGGDGLAREGAWGRGENPGGRGWMCRALQNHVDLSG
jgi:hypothetical protein